MQAIKLFLLLGSKGSFDMAALFLHPFCMQAGGPRGFAHKNPYWQKVEGIVSTTSLCFIRDF